MKSIHSFSIGAITALASVAMTPAAAATRYQDSVFANVSVTNNVVYGSAKTHTGATESLDMDIYQPQGDTAQARPLIIWVHGGGFSAGTKDDGDVVFMCRTYARKGYVTASIDYRLQDGMTTQSVMGAQVVRAVQDAKAAIRYLRANKADLKLDDTRFLMGGTSAGGVVTLGCLFMDPGEIPSYVDTALTGGIEGASGTPGVSSKIHGGINCWGGLGDSTLLYNGGPPLLSFHGTADHTVPYDIGYSLGNPALVTFGSACVHRVLTRKNSPSTLKTFVGMGHGVPGGDKRLDTLLTMTTDFAYKTLFTDGTALRPAPGRRAAPGIAWNSGNRYKVDGRRESKKTARR